VLLFDPQPPPGELPTRFTSPFQPGAPHPLALRAAEELQAQLRRSTYPGLELPGGGKMFGVLIVAAPDGRVGWLRAFSGMLEGRWQHEGFAPPLFDLTSFEKFWPGGEDELRALELEHRALVEGPAGVRRALAEQISRHAAELEALRERHRESRRLRHEARSAGADSHALDQQSRADTAERRRFDDAHRLAREALEAQLRPIDEQRVAIEARRALRSNQLLQQMHATYTVINACGEQRALRSLFAPDEPPGGAGDCAAPRLFGQAYREHLRPLALAEFWWGAPPHSGDRHAGAYYPSCRSKCGVILPFMLEGSDVEPAPLFGAQSAALAEPRVVFEDAWLIVVDKPAGLLSVPGRHAKLRDSVLERLGQRFDEPRVVHRLDLDTSGLLLVAKDRPTHVAIQKQFAMRQIEKRYVAWLEGTVAKDEGRIELPLRVDHEDRPRQIYDPEHGKSALTEWRVLERTPTRTRVELFPRTGRTHQLRVHAAHPLGIGVPIVGDRLYGKEDARLLLHAESLTFTHPHTATRISLQSPAPF
jgi:tRNA pseudouridine32 synthase/23S rRNA pseudouridine746 synthase